MLRQVHYMVKNKSVSYVAKHESEAQETNTAFANLQERRDF